MKSVYFATGNQYKFEEAVSYFGKGLPNYRLELLTVDIPEVQMPTSDAILAAKAQFVAKHFRKDFIVDDASFYTERYKGFPGPYTRFINETIGLEGWRKLFEDGDAITAVAHVALYRAGDIKVFKGEVKGEISFANYKANKISDPRTPLNDLIFIKNENKFLGQLLREGRGFKNHRMRALDGVIEALT